MKRGKRPDAPQQVPGSEMLRDPEARLLFAGVALHGMLAGKSPLPTPPEDVTQDTKPADAAAKLARDAWLIADAMIAEGSK